MQPIIATLGPNSKTISYQSNTTVQEILGALDTVMGAQGWTLWDANASAASHCYRAAIADGLMGYKYIVLDLTSPNYLLCAVYESWNSVSHAGTNVCYSSNASAYGQRLTLGQGGLIWIFATSRYAAFYARTNTLLYGDQSWGSFCGCFEISRDNAEEVPGDLPSFAWVTGGAALGAAQSGSSLMCFSLPRTKLGATAVSANINNTISTIIGRTAGIASGALGLQLPINTNPWSVAQSVFAFTPYAVEATAAQALQIRGRFFGLKILSRNQGTPGDSVVLKTDSQGFLDGAQSAALAQHFVIGETAFNGRFALSL